MIEKNVYFNRLGISVTYWIGQNAKDNFDILDKASTELDWWFHIYNEPSCHVIAHVPGKLDRDDLRYVKTQGAVLCRDYHGQGLKKKVMCARVMDVTKNDHVVGQVHVKKYCVL
jgi:hypothetical protein